MDASSTHAFNGGKISPGMGSWGGPERVRSEWTGSWHGLNLVKDPKPSDPQEQGKAPSSVVRVLQKCQTPPPDPSVDSDSVYRKHPPWPSPSGRSWPQMALLPRLFLIHLCVIAHASSICMWQPHLSAQLSIINMLSLQGAEVSPPGTSPLDPSSSVFAPVIISSPSSQVCPGAMQRTWLSDIITEERE